MKCTKAEKWILLQDSSECSEQRDHALAAHLHDCEACRRFQHALAEVQDIALPEEEPSETLLNNIKREARRQAPEPKKSLLIYWKPALATVASVMIALGLFFSAYGPDRIGLELVMSDTELLDTQDQAISVMYAGLSEDDLAFNFLMTYEES
ncbi:MAG: hypothetical protein KAG97_04015 [Victivallales bacterium]|nr:hypothetical protein [Victivallales bacterium]